MQLSAFGITAGHGKAAPSAGHDTSVCTLVNSSCSGGAVQVARGNRISRAPSPGTFRTFIFRQFWERKIVKNAPHRSGNGTLFRIFVPPNSVRFRFFVPNVSVWNVGNSGRGMATTFCTRPSLKQQPSNQKQQDKHSTTLLVVTLARPPWVSVLEIWNTHLRHTGYLVLSASLHIIAIYDAPTNPKWHFEGIW